ncbi:DUF6962 family protein [Chloroflexus sp.]|uniref:DUF6962 family protein n=1 Tax=Chloroflexus sp. TaxID=1904827 RepID=UPI0026304730|nr:hypothetical protein [uncultured Chloroflexus sp.]
MKQWLSHHIITDRREQTTAATDLLLALAALAAIQRLHVGTSWRRPVWQAAFALLAASGLLGAVIHGLRLSPALRERLWQPLNLLLALIIALFTTGAVSDRWGARAGQRVLPVLVGVAPGFVWISRRIQRGFLAFIAYELIAMIAALAIYADLAQRHQLPGAKRITVGILITMLAAGVQTSSLELVVGDVPFDHNGLFHIVQLAALPLLVEGVRAGLLTDDER